MMQDDKYGLPITDVYGLVRFVPNIDKMGIVPRHKSYSFEPTIHFSEKEFEIVSYGEGPRMLKFPTYAQGEQWVIDRVWEKWRWLLPYWACKWIGELKALKYVTS